MKRVEPIFKPLGRLGHNMRTTGDMQAYTPISPSFSEFSERIIERLLKREIGAWRRFSLYYLEEAQALPEQSPEQNLTQPGVLKLSMLFQVYRQAAVSTHTLSLAPAVFLTRPEAMPRPAPAGGAHRYTEARFYRELETKPGESRIAVVQTPGEREEDESGARPGSQVIYREGDGRTSPRPASRQAAGTSLEHRQADSPAPDGSAGRTDGQPGIQREAGRAAIPAAPEDAADDALAAGEAAQGAYGWVQAGAGSRAAASPLRTPVYLSPFSRNAYFYSIGLGPHSSGQAGMGWGGADAPGYSTRTGGAFPYEWAFAADSSVGAASAPSVSEGTEGIAGRYEARYPLPWETRLAQTFYIEPAQADGAPGEAGAQSGASRVWRFSQERHIYSLFSRVARLAAMGFPGRPGAAGSPGVSGVPGVSSAGLPGEPGVPGFFSVYGWGVPGAFAAYAAPHISSFGGQAAVTAARYSVHYLTPWEARPAPTMHVQPWEAPAASPAEASAQLSPQALRLRWERQVQSLFTRIERLTGFPAPRHAAARITPAGSLSLERNAEQSTQALRRVLETRIKEALPAGVLFKTGDVSSREELAQAAFQMAAQRQPLSPAQRQSLNRLLERAYPGAAAHLAARFSPQKGQSAAPAAEAILDVLLRDAPRRGDAAPRMEAGRLSALNLPGKRPAAARPLPPLWRSSPFAAAEGRLQDISRRYRGAPRLNVSALEPLAARWAVKSLDVWSFRPAQLTFNLNPALVSEGSWAAEPPLPPGRRIRRSDTILRRFLRRDRLDWLSQTVERRASRALRRYVAEPARMIRFVPAAYINQYGRLQPVGKTDWTEYGYNGDGTPPVAMGRLAERQVVHREGGPVSRREQEAQQFFQDVNRLFGGASAGAGGMGRIAGPGLPLLRPPEISYKQNESDATGKLVSQQMNQPRSLNQPLKPQREIKIQGEGELDERQIARVADRVFDKIERRIQNERRRFGL